MILSEIVRSQCWVVAHSGGLVVLDAKRVAAFFVSKLKLSCFVLKAYPLNLIVLMDLLLVGMSSRILHLLQQVKFGCPREDFDLLSMLCEIEVEKLPIRLFLP